MSYIYIQASICSQIIIDSATQRKGLIITTNLKIGAPKRLSTFFSSGQLLGRSSSPLTNTPESKPTFMSVHYVKGTLLSVVHVFI